MKNAIPSSVFARLAMLLCMLSLSTTGFAQDTKTTPTPTPKASASQSTAQPAASKNTSSQTSQKVNINTASAEEIATKLKGIGLKKAQAIVAHREANGQFASKEALTAVKGIGDSTLAQNSELISLK